MTSSSSSSSSVEAFLLVGPLVKPSRHHVKERRRGGGGEANVHRPLLARFHETAILTQVQLNCTGRGQNAFLLSPLILAFLFCSEKASSIKPRQPASIVWTGKGGGGGDGEEEGDLFISPHRRKKTEWFVAEKGGSPLKRI